MFSVGLSLRENRNRLRGDQRRGLCVAGETTAFRVEYIGGVRRKCLHQRLMRDRDTKLSSFDET